jgi:hypothetical protein
MKIETYIQEVKKLQGFNANYVGLTDCKILLNPRSCYTKIYKPVYEMREKETIKITHSKGEGIFTFFTDDKKDMQLFNKCMLLLGLSNILPEKKEKIYRLSGKYGRYVAIFNRNKYSIFGKPITVKGLEAFNLFVFSPDFPLNTFLKEEEIDLTNLSKYSITEVTTGLAFSRGETVKECVEKAIAILNDLGLAKIKGIIDENAKI